MANYYGSGRSNYVHFTDIEKVKKICSYYRMEVCIDSSQGHAIFPDNENETGDAENYLFDLPEKDIPEMRSLLLLPKEEDSDITELPDFLDIVCRYLPDGEVLIWMHVGNEKLRYLTGYAVAINNKGKRRQVSIDDIFTKAKALGTTITGAEY